MKQVVSGKILKAKINEAVNLLCNTVKTTLGPKGSNAIIDHSAFSPFITNDGVTIAENIESDDEVINTILELVKEASIKTNETVGDGTTTTLVFLQSIFKEGANLINNGVNPIILKEELLKALDEVKKSIISYSKIPSKEELKYIANISANDEKIGKIISEVFLKILNKNAIYIKEGNSTETKINYLTGYKIDSDLASPYFLSNINGINLDTVKILLINYHLENLEDISNIINNILLTKDNLVIIANSYNNYLTEEIININNSNNTSIILLNILEYGYKRMEIMEDLAAITGAKIINNSSFFDSNVLGIVDNISITKEYSLFNFKFNDQVKKRVVELNNLLNKENNDYEFISNRLTMFEKGSATIEVGGLTKIEKREKKMRFDDALWAISEASLGISAGSGITPCLISNTLNQKTDGSKILKKALEEPLKVILSNAGKNEEIINTIREKDYKILYNVKTDKYEDVNNTMVLDPTSVIIESISNAVSIASLLLTTDNLIINEYKNKLNKINEYSDY